MNVIIDKLTFEWKGRTITARLEITPGHQWVNTYTIHANRTSAMFVFRKIEGVWQQVYGSELKVKKKQLLVRWMRGLRSDKTIYFTI